ncbi:MAG TPA: tetratricopeptide repeat protein [Bacteroidia bacterium]|nr:tetratricopeptide repeat protein [Bacteroidia bacterium]
MAKAEPKTKEQVIDIEGAFDRAEHYIEENRKSLLFIVGGIVLLVGLYFGWKYFYIQPRTEEANSKMYRAEMLFAKDSFNLAINGHGDTTGFADIVEDYGGTSAGNISRYYLGICYMRTNQYDKAIDVLKDFDSNDEFVGSMALGLIGDAYMEKQQTDDAIEYYLKAAKRKPNKFTSPVFLKKAAFAYEDKGNKDEALKLFEQIKVEFPESQEATQVDKYIARNGGEVK